MSNLILKSNCVGLDCDINRAQQKLYNTLNPVWGGDWDCYPRIYKNKQVNNVGEYSFVPEYLDGGFEYSSDTLFNDKVDVTSFFLEGDASTVENNIIESKVSIIFSCQIDRIYPGNQKEDMKMRGDIYDVVTSFNDNWTLTDISTTVDKVYKEFHKEGLKFTDMSKMHLLRFDFDVKYSFNC